MTRGERVAIGWILAAACTTVGAAAQVANTPHNLSVSGPGAIRASTETEVCVFCHTPHTAQPQAPLWNRRTPAATYVPYTSSTGIAQPGQPTGASLLCLSCHDGTIALGEVMSRPGVISMAGGVTTLPPGATNIGTDLSDDHPVSFAYTEQLAQTNGELTSPSTLTGRVRLDNAGQMQCTACHDPHDDTRGDFLVETTQASALCTTCHAVRSWSAASHTTATKTWNGVPPDPWPHTTWTTVADNACESCHRPHTAGGHARSLNDAVEENNCTTCHNGNVAAKNVQSDMTKLSGHPVSATTGVHDPAEAAVSSTRHVECADCHNPHAARSGPGGPLAGVRGVNASGVEVAEVTAEYQVCFRCHADSQNRPAARTARQIVQTNTRLEFALGNPSYHPVVGPGVNPDVPSLLPPWTTTSVMACLDCHNSNTAPPAGGTGANGPHGSTYVPILVRQYITADNTSESSTAYALCYACHSRTSILDNDSFKEHDKHIRGERTPCNVCHDPHGISATQGTSINNSKLINFDTRVVTPNSRGVLRYESTGRFQGSCSLRCHGEDHDGESYP